MWIAGLAVLVAEIITSGWLVYLYSKGRIAITFDKGADVATLVLTAATLVVTGVAVLVGVVTVWGYREILERAVAAAVKAAEPAAVNAARTAVAGMSRDVFQAGQASPTDEEARGIADAVDEGSSS